MSSLLHRYLSCSDTKPLRGGSIRGKLHRYFKDSRISYTQGQSSYSLESQGERYQNLGRSGKVAIFSRKLKGQGKLGKSFEHIL